MLKRISKIFKILFVVAISVTFYSAVLYTMLETGKTTDNKINFVFLCICWAAIIAWSDALWSLINNEN